LQLGLIGLGGLAEKSVSLNQPLVTTGAGALPLPTGALPTQAVRPKARAIEQITTNNFLIGDPLKTRKLVSPYSIDIRFITSAEKPHVIKIRHEMAKKKKKIEGAPPCRLQSGRC
jgi:hypothetical protein